MDDVTALQEPTEEVLATDVHLFTPREAVLWKPDRRLDRSVTGDKNWRGRNAPAGTAISYWLGDDEDHVEIVISNVIDDQAFRTMTGTGDRGLNRVQWDLRGDVRDVDGFSRGSGPLASPGVYRVRLIVDGDEYASTVEVLEDVWLAER